MTIVEAITEVLQKTKAEEGMTTNEIVEGILSWNLYSFNTPVPYQVVNQAIRRHCEGLDFPSASPYKAFYIVHEKIGSQGTRYQLIDNRKDKDPEQSIGVAATDEDSLPEEKIMMYVNQHLQEIRRKLLDIIMTNPPAFFENLVVKLLMKIGYGYDEKSGKVVGKPNDGGVDGIINEDALGLDKIYIQAKRYSQNQTIGRPELQAFAGAMMSEGIKKGVFITTSSFKKTAIDYVSRKR